MNAEKILTVPTDMVDYQPYYLTGNHYVSLPMISPVNGGIQGVNLIVMNISSLVEFCGVEGDELLRPFVNINGERLHFEGHLNWKYKSHWIPEFTYKNIERAVAIQGRIFAPLDLRGFIYSLEFCNESKHEMELEAGIEGAWYRTQKTLFSQRAVPGTNHLFYDEWTDSVVMEGLSWGNTGALAIGWGQALSGMSLWKQREDRESIATGQEVKAENNGAHPLGYQLRNNLKVQPGESVQLHYYVAANMERDGARTSAVDMKRHGAEAKYRDLKQWLGAHKLHVGDNDLIEVLNKNLFFNYFFALGRAIDTEEIVMITTRSPRYYVSAAYWPRDAFLWSYPALLLVDTKLAREVLVTGFSRHMKNGGIHAQYINGTVLYPGFELDQLCAYIIALKGYLNQTGDVRVLKESKVIQGVKTFYHNLQENKGNIGLYRTFLDPSDDPVTYPYLIYDNTLVWVALSFLEELNMEHQLISSDLKVQAGEVKNAITKHGIVEHGGRRLYAWAVDGQGNFEVYDNPPGSLMTLEHYGFEVDKEVFRNTLDWIRSGENPYYCDKGEFKGSGSLHAGGPWILGVANSLLAGFREESGDFLKRAHMDNGFACETVNEATGVAKTGSAFATCAGFLAYAIYRGFGKERLG